MTDPLDWIDAELAGWSERGLARRLDPLGHAKPGRIERDGRELINFASNDYLGLAADPRVIEAAAGAGAAYGWGSGASPLVCGWREPHAALARDLAEFERVEAVALFPTGFAANLGTIAALLGPGDAVYLDRLDHACLLDGARLSGARLRPYPHLDADRLTSFLARDRGRFRRSMIATDGVFSMDGDLAPLGRLADLAEEFGAMLLVDEAHGTGVFGPEGRGACAECGVAERVPIRVGTLSKALGSLGGFVAGPGRLIDYLVAHARPLLYSTALPAAAAAAAGQALVLSLAEPWRRERVHASAGRLRRALSALGYAIPPSLGPIVPVILREAEEVLRLSARLRDLGFLAPAIRPPTVPVGTSRLRFSVTAAHSDDDLDSVIAAMGTLRT